MQDVSLVISLESLDQETLATCEEQCSNIDLVSYIRGFRIILKRERERRKEDRHSRDEKERRDRNRFRK